MNTAKRKPNIAETLKGRFVRLRGTELSESEIRKENTSPSISRAKLFKRPTRLSSVRTATS